MRLYKLLEIIDKLSNRFGVSLHGQIYPSYGGELTLELTSQPSILCHEYLLKKGFVSLDDGRYIYRPR